MVARLVALLGLAGAGWLAIRQQQRAAPSPTPATRPGQGGAYSGDWPAMGLDLSLDMGLGDDWSLGGIFGGSDTATPTTTTGGDMSDKPRGIRNNNPGNIEAGDPWQGLDNPADDGRFARFVSPEYGIRAMARVITNYRNLYDLRTVGSIVQRWAPAHENHTNAYIVYVADQLGVNPAVEFDVIGRLPELIAAMIRFENGQQPYAMATIEKGVALA